MNDELELIEEFQSDSIDELVSERKKNKAIQRFTTQPSNSTKYYYIENYPNGDSLKSEIAPENLDELGKKDKSSLAKQKHRSDSLQAVNSVVEKWLKTELQKSRAEHCDGIVDRNPEQTRFIKGWFNRINDIGNKFGCDTIFKSRHLKK